VVSGIGTDAETARAERSATGAGRPDRTLKTKQPVDGTGSATSSNRSPSGRIKNRLASSLSRVASKTCRSPAISKAVWCRRAGECNCSQLVTAATDAPLVFIEIAEGEKQRGEAK
jgi:hypothetical protein